MGTSSARRGPTTPLWRLAKAAATRYLAPEEAARVEAREVAARYVAALGESQGSASRDWRGSFRLIRKVAQNLGAFLAQAASLGPVAARADWGLGEVATQPEETWAPVLSAVLTGGDGGLEAAVARASLGAVWERRPEREEGPGAPEAAGPAVRDFLAAALYYRLVLDLGESLEAAAPGISRLKHGLRGLREFIEAAAGLTPAAEPPPPDQWLGLAGWAWVTGIMETLAAGVTQTLSRGEGG
jgi:hypothetical protein